MGNGRSEIEFCPQSHMVISLQFLFGFGEFYNFAKPLSGHLSSMTLLFQIDGFAVGLCQYGCNDKCRNSVSNPGPVVS